MGSEQSKLTSKSDFRKADISSQFSKYEKTSLCQTINVAEPRPCFVSLYYIATRWKEIPLPVLHHSLFIFYCDRRWVFSPNCYRPNMHPIEKLCVKLKLNEDKEFLSLLLNKEMRGQLLWVDPVIVDKMNEDNANTNEANETHHASPAWQSISDWLHLQSDPISVGSYRPITTSTQWWIEKFKEHETTAKESEFTSENLSDIMFCSDLDKLCDELKELTWGFRPLLEILHQSNPTMVPMAIWDAHKYESHSAHIKLCTKSLTLDDISSASTNIINTRPHKITQQPSFSLQASNASSTISNIDFCDDTIADDIEIDNNTLRRVHSIRVCVHDEDDDNFVYLY